MARRTEAHRITIARLDGTARRLLRERVGRDECIAELRAISTDPKLLGHAAGTALGSWQDDNIRSHDGDRVARMLLAAGADQAVMEQRAEETRRRLGVRRPGIGNPTY